MFLSAGYDAILRVFDARRAISMGVKFADRKQNSRDSKWCRVEGAEAHQGHWIRWTLYRAYRESSVKQLTQLSCAHVQSDRIMFR
jgi:hypothetical protein